MNKETNNMPFLKRLEAQYEMDIHQKTNAKFQQELGSQTTRTSNFYHDNLRFNCEGKACLILAGIGFCASSNTGSAALTTGTATAPAPAPPAARVPATADPLPVPARWRPPPHL